MRVSRRSCTPRRSTSATPRRWALCSLRERIEQSRTNQAERPFSRRSVLAIDVSPASWPSHKRFSDARSHLYDHFRDSRRVAVTQLIQKREEDYSRINVLLRGDEHRCSGTERAVT